LTILSMDSVCRLRASTVHSFSASLHFGRTLSQRGGVESA
jgi:hypothetical protein